MNLRTKAAVGLTAIYVCGFFLIAAFRWNELIDLPLNALGDFLAGAFGPLALAWLVFGYFQQGDELRQGTEALRLQATELNNSVKQQSELAKAANSSLAHHEELLEPLLQVNHMRTDVFTLDEKIAHSDSFAVKNSGSYCEELVFHFRLNSEERGVVSLSSLGSQQTTEFVVTNVVAENVYYDLDVDYLKSNRRAGRQRFEVQKVSEHGRWIIRVFKKFD
ncbi:hypothetical protein ABXV19_09890 [Pseudomonas alkylphenolica]|uniref:hypothetical protein n=1 Tax=Pseudomonas alkylphenolica TaxID=237609 RepID=UPI003397EA6B